MKKKLGDHLIDLEKLMGEDSPTGEMVRKCFRDVQKKIDADLIHEKCHEALLKTANLQAVFDQQGDMDCPHYEKDVLK